MSTKCTRQLTRNMSPDKEDKLEELSIKIEAHTGSAASLQEDITKANEMVATIDMHMGEATEIREIGKKENEISVKDAQDAQTALSNAISVLKECLEVGVGVHGCPKNADRTG